MPASLLLATLLRHCAYRAVSEAVGLSVSPDACLCSVFCAVAQPLAGGLARQPVRQQQVQRRAACHSVLPGVLPVRATKDVQACEEVRVPCRCSCQPRGVALPPGHHWGSEFSGAQPSARLADGSERAAGEQCHNSARLAACCNLLEAAGSPGCLTAHVKPLGRSAHAHPMSNGMTAPQRTCQRPWAGRGCLGRQAGVLLLQRPPGCPRWACAR